MREKNGSTLENVFFGAALVLFLVVGFFAAKRFGLFPNRPSGGTSSTPPPPSPDGRFRVGIDEKDVQHPVLKTRSGGPSVGAVPQVKATRVARKPRKTFIPKPN
jgi:hypothetical protein